MKLDISEDNALKFFAIVVFLLIVYSMASALYYMYKDKGQSTRMVRSLSIRIGLSFFLFIVMMIAHKLNMAAG